MRCVIWLSTAWCPVPMRRTPNNQNERAARFGGSIEIIFIFEVFEMTNTNVSMDDAAGIADAIPASKPAETFDPFDVGRLTLSQNFLAAAGVKKVLTTVPVRKPSKEWFIRTHPDPQFHINTCVIELKEDSELYLVDPSLWDTLTGESTFGPRALITTINRQNVLFLWPIRLPDPDGRIDDWNRSALDASQRAKDAWVRVQSNRSLGAYEVYEATGDCGEPKWDVPSFSALLRIAFKDRFIDTEDHPILRRLRGEA